MPRHGPCKCQLSLVSSEMKANFQKLSPLEKEMIQFVYFQTVTLRRFVNDLLLVTSRSSIDAFVTLLIRPKTDFELPFFTCDYLVRSCIEYAAACHVIRKVIVSQCAIGGRVIEPDLWPTIFQYFICYNNPENIADFNKKEIVY